MNDHYQWLLPVFEAQLFWKNRVWLTIIHLVRQFIIFFNTSFLLRELKK